MNTMLYNTLKFLWDYKAWIFVGGLIASTYHFYNLYEAEKLDKQLQLTTLTLQYTQAVNDQNTLLITQYTNVNKRLTEIQEGYKDVQIEINNVANKLNDRSNSLLQTINNHYTTAEGDNSELASSVRKLSELSTSCIGRYAEMGTNAQREKVAKETLQQGWKAVQEEYDSTDEK